MNRMRKRSDLAPAGGDWSKLGPVPYDRDDDGEDDEEDAPRGHPLRHTLPDGYSSTNFAWTLYCNLMVLKSSGSSAAASSARPAALALRITAMLS